MHYQLVGEDAPQVPMDPLEFMLAPLSMTNVEYALWRPGVAYVNWHSKELDCEEFNCTLFSSSRLFLSYSLPLYSCTW